MEIECYETKEEGGGGSTGEVDDSGTVTRDGIREKGVIVGVCQL